MQNWIFDMRSRTFVLLTGAFFLVSGLVYFDVTAPLDYSAVLLASENVGNPGVDLFMQIITESGDTFYMLGFGILMLIIKKTRRIGITLMILIVISTLVTGYVKCGVDRDRPPFEYEGASFPVTLSRDTFALFCEGGFVASYPSGHAARTMIFAIILGFALSGRFPRGAYLMFLYPALMSVSRIYVLQHYPMDIVGGVILGVMLSGVLAKRTKLHRIFGRSVT
ncbi:MAG: phosphatase PAP2 family protein [Thaumarchaeota archaeon]|nr:phosphatase PAP2 family protein [Nitrososphaerota archaeon]